MARNSNRRSPENLKAALMKVKAAKVASTAKGSLSGIKSDTYNAGLRYVGGSGGKKAPFIPEEDYKASLPVGLPPVHKTVAQVMERYVSDFKNKPRAIPKYIIEGTRNDALKAAADGDFDSATRIADSAKFLEVQKMVWGNKGLKAQGFPQGGFQGQGKKPAGGKKQGPADGYTGDEEHNPFKRALGKVLGAPGVQQALKAVRMPYSYVASHLSDISQELEQGDIGGALTASARTIPIGGGLIGETVDAARGKGFDVAGLANSYENEKTRKDFWKQTGVGEYLQRGLDKHHWDDGTFLNDKWVKRGIGFAGDVALDPLTYLTAGTTKLAGSSANVATRITEAGAELASKEGAEAFTKAIASGVDREVAEEVAKNASEEVGKYIRERAATVIAKGKNRLSAEDIRRIFPNEKVAGGLAWRVPFTGRITRGIVKAGTGGKVNIEEKLIPLLGKDITNPAQRLLSKPARALGASKLSTKLVGKFGGELGAELRNLIRSDNPETVYKGLGIKRSLNVMRSRAASGVRVLPEDMKQLFPDATDLLVGEGEHVVGPNLSRLWVKHIAPAIKGREKEIMQAIESGNAAGVEGADKVINFYRAARGALTKQGAVFGDIGEEYIPRMFTEEGRKALEELSSGIPEGTTAIDPKAAFMKNRALLEELGVKTQDEARALLETVYGKNLKGGQVFEPDLHKIAAQYIRLADQQQGRQALIKELEGWGIALKPDEMEHYIGVAGEKSPKVVANQIVNKTMKAAPLAQKRAAQRAIQLSFEDATGKRVSVIGNAGAEGRPTITTRSGDVVDAEEWARSEAVINAEGELDPWKGWGSENPRALDYFGNPLPERDASAVEGLGGRLRTPTGAPVTPEEQAAMDALTAGVSGEPIPASEVIGPQYNDALSESLASDIQQGALHPSWSTREKFAIDWVANRYRVDVQRAEAMLNEVGFFGKSVDVPKLMPDLELRGNVGGVGFHRNGGPRTSGLFNISGEVDPVSEFRDPTDILSEFGVNDPVVRYHANADANAERQRFINLINSGKATPEDRAAFAALEAERLAGVDESLAAGRESVLAKREARAASRAAAEKRYNARVSAAKSRLNISEEIDPYSYDYSQDYTGLETGPEPMRPRIARDENGPLPWRRDIASSGSSDFVTSPIPPNPTDDMMFTSKQMVDDTLDFIANDDMSMWSNEARDLVQKHEFGRFTNQDAIRWDELQAERSEYLNELLRSQRLRHENVVKGRLYHVLAGAGVGVDATTGEVLSSEMMMDRLFKIVNESPDPEAMKSVLQRLGAESRRSIAQEEKAMIGLGQWDDAGTGIGVNPSTGETMYADQSSVDDLVNSTDPSSDEFIPHSQRALEDPEKIAGSFYDPAAADSAGDVADAFSLDKIDNLRNAQRDIQHRIDVFNAELPLLKGQKKIDVMLELHNLGNDLDELQQQVFRLGKRIEEYGDNWDEYAVSALELGSNKGRREGFLESVRNALGNEKMPLSSDEVRQMRLDMLSKFADQENLGDVYLGMQKMIDDSSRLNLEIGDQQIRMAEGINSVATTLYDLRVGNRADFVIPDERTVQRVITNRYGAGKFVSAEQQVNARLALSGQRVRDFYRATMENIDQAFKDLTHAASSGLDRNEISRISEMLVSQRNRLYAALISGKSEELYRVMILQSVEGTGGTALNVSSEAIDNIASAITNNSKVSLERTMRSLEMPAHPMGAREPSPIVDANRAVEEHARRTQQEFWHKRGRDLVEKANKRGHWLPDEIDQLRIAKRNIADLGTLPSGEMWSVDVAAEQRLAKEIAANKDKFIERINAKRIVRSGDGYTVADPDDFDSVGVLRRYESNSRDVARRLSGKARSAEERAAEAAKSNEEYFKYRPDKPLDDAKTSARRELTPLERQSNEFISRLTKAYNSGDMDLVEEIRAAMDDIVQRRKDLAPPKPSPEEYAKARADLYKPSGKAPEGKETFDQVLQRRLAAGEDAPYVIVGTGTRSVVKNPEDMKALVDHLTIKIRQAVATHGSVKIVSGGAEGFDEALAVAAYRAGVPYHLDLPHSTYADYAWGRGSRTGFNRKSTFQKMLDNAESVEFTDFKAVNNKGASNFNRNQVMMGRADEVWALPSSSSGTKHGIQTAERIGLTPVNIEYKPVVPSVVIDNPSIPFGDVIGPSYEQDGIRYAEARISQGKAAVSTEISRLKAELNGPVYGVRNLLRSRPSLLPHEEFMMKNAALKRLEQHVDAMSQLGKTAAEAAPKGGVAEVTDKLIAGTSKPVSIPMNFSMPEGERLAGVTADNTLDAISNGERTATTRWGRSQMSELDQIEIGQEVAFTAKGKQAVTATVIDVENVRFVPKSEGGPKFIVTAKSTGETTEFSPKQFFARWSDREGWTVERGKRFFNERIAKGQLEARQLVFEKTAAEVAPKSNVQGKIISTDVFADQQRGYYAVIPTNTVVKANGEAVMGAGLAKQAAERYPDLPARYGQFLQDAELSGGTKMMVDHENRVILVPTKVHWKNPSSPELVQSAIDSLGTVDVPMAVPHLGAGLGGVDRQQVIEMLRSGGIVDELRPARRGISSGSETFNVTDGMPSEGFPRSFDVPSDDFGMSGPRTPRVGAATVRASVGGSEGAQDALNAAADLSQPEAALDDTAAVVSGQHDDDLVASIEEVHDDPATPPRKRRILRDARDWVGGKKGRVAAANVAANGDPAAEAAIAVQSQAENAGILRYMKYPTSDPVETFKRLNNLDTITEASQMIKESGDRLAWLQQSQGYVTDVDTASILNQVKKVNTPEGMQSFLKYYDKFMTYIKAWQLTTPGFHVRNMMGGIFNNYLADVDIAATSRFLKNLKKFKAGELTGEEAEWMKIIYEHAGSGQYSHHEIGVASNVQSTYNPLSPRFKMLAGSAKYGGDVEFRLRGALIWDRLSKGKGLQEALDDVTRYHFDYSNLSNFETGVVKRIIPFYVWTRYNFPLQLEMMATSPSKYRFYQQFKHTMEGRADEGKPVPEFLKNEMFGIPLPTHIGGGQNFLALDLPFTRTMAGATPDVENWDPKKLGSYPTLLDPYASQMAVPLKLPAELALSRQFFKGIPLKDTSRTQEYAVGGYGPAANALGGSTKADYIAEQLMPLYGQFRRLFPTETKNKDKRLTNFASYMGVPLRTNTKQDQQNELMRRSFLR